jgi:uncharacterized repeat protein (TIGR03803 family)
MKSITKSTMITLLAALMLAGCGGGDSSTSSSGAASAGNNSAASYTLGGSVSGLNGGSLMLSDNGGAALTVNANGGFTFPTTMAGNSAYSVTVAQQPRGQVCTVSNASGAGVVGNVSNIAVTCAVQTYSIAGSVSGLAAGQSLTLQNNGADAQAISANGTFTFATPVAANSSYAITVASQPSQQVCTVSNGSGSGVVANIGNVSVTCSTDSYVIGGTTSGLAAGQQVTLLNNGADPQIVTANGAFSFAVPVVANSSYAVTVGTQPTGETCTVSNASGAGVVANINNIAVTCSANTYTISGTVSGLASGQQVTLNDNGGDALTINANGSFTFATPVVFNGSYAVTVGTQPLAQTCSITNAIGAGVVANISNVAVNCASTTYTVSGTLFGLTAGQQVTIVNNGANPMTLTGNGNFTFATPVVSGGSYLISVGTQPVIQTCSVSNGRGGPIAGNVSGVAINCSTNVLQLSGSLSGLNSGEQVTLNLNGVAPLTLTANGIFGYANSITYGSSYSITVGTQPLGQSCTVSNGSGSNATANIGNVSVACAGATESVLYAFGGLINNNDGGTPMGGLTQGSDGNFYGFTTSGGDHNYGTFFKFTPSGIETKLYSFGASSGDGIFPQGVPVLGSDGNFYGVAQDGGANGNGVIFRITPAGAETILHSFGTGANDGFLPAAGLMLASDGNFYGTTQLGGVNHEGTVFKISTSGPYSQVYSFDAVPNDAATPLSGLMQGSDGNFYGTSYYGGANSVGAVYKLTPGGTETVLYSFTGGSDGKYPVGNLVQGTDGNFYGVTYKGGNGLGTAYMITPGGSESVLYAFSSNDAQEPNGALALGSDGNFYGISQYGGTNNNGTLFKLTPAGVETVLWSFGGSGDGKQPYGALLIASDGYIYGVTSNGGSATNGVVFRY